MDWIDSVGNAEFLRKLFPRAPSPCNVRVLEVNLHQDGPRVLVRLDLNEFPLQPPAKWMPSNQAQIGLIGFGFRELKIQG